MNRDCGARLRRVCAPCVSLTRCCYDAPRLSECGKVPWDALLHMPDAERGGDAVMGAHYSPLWVESVPLLLAPPITTTTSGLSHGNLTDDS